MSSEAFDKFFQTSGIQVTDNPAIDIVCSD